MILNSNKLIQLRKIKKLSQIELAKMAGITKPTLNAIEKGGDIKLSILENISKALNVSFLYFLDVEQSQPIIAEESEGPKYEAQSIQVMLRQILTNTEKLLDKKKITENLTKRVK